jgi:hypothetical protein
MCRINHICNYHHVCTTHLNFAQLFFAVCTLWQLISSDLLPFLELPQPSHDTWQTNLPSDVVFLALYHVNIPTQTQNHQNSNSNKFISRVPWG